MTNLNTLYLTCCDAVLESGGLQSGLWSVEEFLAYFVDVTTDFLQRTGLYKKFDILVQGLGASQYTFDDWAMEIQALFSNEKFVFRGTEDDISSAHQNWVGQVGTPREWHEDLLLDKLVEVFPAPSTNGNQVQTTAINGYYGTLSAVGSGDISVAVTAPFYGTIASNLGGDMHLETAGPLYGTMQSLVESRTNIAAIATASLFNLAVSLSSYVELLHDTFTVWIKYGVLGKMWTKDGDGKNDAQARYAFDLYEQGIKIGKAISGEGLLQEAA